MNLRERYCPAIEAALTKARASGTRAAVTAADG